MVEWTISILMLAVLPAQAAPFAKCDLGRCFNSLSSDTRQRVLNKETVLVSETKTGSEFSMNYVYRLVENVSPELAVGVFASFSEHKANLDAIEASDVLSERGDRVSVYYELNTSKLQKGMSGLLSKMAGLSKYVVNEHIFKLEGGAYGIVWEIDPSQTEQHYKKKSLFGGNLSKPEYIHGFMIVEPVAGTPHSVISYANYVVLESGTLKKAARTSGTLNSAAGDALIRTVDATAAWIESVAKQPEAVRDRYTQKLCNLFLSR